MSKVTIKDIARRAQVAPGTVSKILTEKYKEDKIHISQSTINRVQEIVKELNYQPNYGARILSTGKSFTIGIYIPNIRHENFSLGHYYSSLINSIEKEAVKYEYDILMINYNSYVNKFNTSRIDGLIIIKQDKVSKELKYLISEKKPFVIINKLINDELDTCSVNLDNYQGVRSVVQYFKENNHQKLAFIGELIPRPQKEHILRLHYFISILEEEALPVNKDLYLLDNIPGITEKIHKEDYDQLSGYYGMKHLIQNHYGEFTGIFCANDIIAAGAAKFLYETGIRVPEDISIIGFDDNELSSYIMGGLTTIKQPLDLIGKHAFIELLSMIKHKENITRDIRIRPELVVRNTVAFLKTITTN